MTRLFLLAVLVAACGGDSTDPHAIGACMGWTDTQGNPLTGDCEAACKSPPTASGMSCDTEVQLNCRSFDFEGTRGCCIQDANMGAIRFHECVVGGF